MFYSHRYIKCLMFEIFHLTFTLRVESDILGFLIIIIFFFCCSDEKPSISCLYLSGISENGPKRFDHIAIIKVQNRKNKSSWNGILD